MFRLAAAALVLVVPTASSAEEEAAPLPAWLAGSWATSDESGARTEEVWLPPRGGMMLGMSREGTAQQIRSWEVLRIRNTPDGSIVFIAQPGGAPPVEFTLSDQRTAMIEFQNRANDYPQRIRYWREGDTLRAEISLLDGSRQVGWSYTPIDD
jgi:hypothetical protein